jgi:predicted nucleic acid-binding protein
MKVYLDTNIIIDILERRESYYVDSNALFLLAVDKKIDCIIGASSITDIFYIINSKKKDTQKSIQVIFDLLKIIQAVDTIVSDMYVAANMKFSDFEDAVVASTAVRECANYIVTRNVKDFINSPVPAISPTEFLQKIKDNSSR